MNWVVDASVAAKWYFPERGGESADALLEQGARGDADLIAPDLIVAEFTNVLCKKVGLEECRPDEAAQILALFDTDRPRLLDSAVLAARALDLALTLDLSAYDALYLASAVEHEAGLATADTALARTARRVLREVTLVA